MASPPPKPTAPAENALFDGSVRYHPAGNTADDLSIEASTFVRGNEAKNIWTRIVHAIFGRSLSVAQESGERLPPLLALPILSSDALSSVAYATEASLAVLLAAGSARLAINLWIGLITAALILIVGNSYYQTILAYPSGGGSYVVARDNLQGYFQIPFIGYRKVGVIPGLVAAAALSVDYILTVSVSVAAGISAIISVFPGIAPFAVELDLAVIALIIVTNLRGVREAGMIFAIPTYLFLISFGVMLASGVLRALAHGGLMAAPPPVTHSTQSLTVFLVLTAFASGCSALTGVEAISNSVPIFTGQTPEERSHNAARTLATMIIILASFFLVMTFLAWRLGVAPNPSGYPTVASQIAQFAAGNSWLGWLYYVVQLATLLVLVFAANTSFAGFPRLLSILAKDRYLPGFFMYRGERFAFNVGIILLGGLSALLLVIFRGNVIDLINLYALGVFVAFTLSQTGMVVHWRRKPNVDHRGRRMLSNAVGAIATGIVAIVIGVSKFDRGAWVVVILIPAIVGLFLALRAYYSRQHVYQLDKAAFPDPPADLAIVTLVFFPDAIAELKAAALAAKEVIAVKIVDSDDEAKRFAKRWKILLEDTAVKRSAIRRLEIVESPYRTIAAPIETTLEKIVRDERARGNQNITIVFPYRIEEKWWEVLIRQRVGHHVHTHLINLIRKTQEDLTSPFHGVTLVELPYTLGETSLKRRHEHSAASSPTESPK
jgi:amino acid transporter